MKFPEVLGANLERRLFHLPGDLEGRLNILLMPFQQWQQWVVNSWLPLARKIESRYPAVRYYELPVLPKYLTARPDGIDTGIWRGMAGPHFRERTIPLFVDKAAFRAGLELASEDTLALLVIDRRGSILWREEGGIQDHKAAALVKAVEARLALELPFSTLDEGPQGGRDRL